ncbi:ssDNA-binding protein [Methylobacterium brachiatum]|uniref:ssDNA-binding protein n=1 Tax=Methylobacterium brachiatum TaxID=269660 RepID=UPI0008F0E802|nr:ssDNA-binding protein [Methylobacterium brachiatum]SFI05185.1 Protein of unknown function [Methylobacterium brachiatum]
MTSRTEDFRSPLARLSRVNLYKPRPNKKDPTKVKYEVNLLFPKSADLSEIKAAVIEAAKAEWGEKAIELLKNGAIKQPILDGDGPQGVSKKTGARYPELEGMYFIRCASNLQPALLSKKVTAAVEGRDLYSGCYGYAAIHAYTWESDENGRGVSIGISMVQHAKDGEKLGGIQADPSKYFEAIPDDDDAPGGGAGDVHDGAGALFS